MSRKGHSRREVVIESENETRSVALYRGLGVSVKNTSPKLEECLFQVGIE